jgi:hypothetical protein
LNFDLLNTANLVLLPKKEGAEKIGDYHPISLIHSIAKLLAKVLALRLTPAMQQLISKIQSVFIRGRSIHDNFMYVRNMARHFHRNKTNVACEAGHLKGFQFGPLGLHPLSYATHGLPDKMEKLACRSLLNCLVANPA